MTYKCKLVRLIPFRDPIFEDLSDEEQLVYFDWLETLQIQGYVSMDISDEEFMDKIYRMYRCDSRFDFNPNTGC